MHLFNKNVKRDLLCDTELKINEIYVAKTIIKSSYDNGKNYTKDFVEYYFLVFKKDDRCFDVFSHTEIEKLINISKFPQDLQHFDIPYITKLIPLTNYINDSTKKEADSSLLFYFITTLNIRLIQGNFEENDEDLEAEN